MKRALLPLLIAIAGVPATSVHAGMDMCDFHSDYDFRVDTHAIEFKRDHEHGTAGDIIMRNGHLQVDGKPVRLSAVDQERVAEYERQVRDLLPRAAAVAREAVGIAFDALGQVAGTFAEDGSARAHWIERLNRQHAQALAHIDSGFSAGNWSGESIDHVVEDTLTQIMPELVGQITARAVSAALSGDPARAKSLQARAEALDKAINDSVDSRADALELRARALCPRMAALERLEHEIDADLPGGQRLDLLQLKSGSRHD